MTLTREQAAALREPLGRQLDYLGRLRSRLERMGFTPSDPLYQRLQAAWIAAHALHVEVHYLACSPATVGRGDSDNDHGSGPVST